MRHCETCTVYQFGGFQKRKSQVLAQIPGVRRQGLSAPINDLFGITYVLMFLGGLSIAGGVLFWSIRW